MKTKLACLILLVLVVPNLKAQTFGIKGGVNFANMTVSMGGSSISAKSLTGFHIGPVVDYALQNKLHFNTGILYSTKGFKSQDFGEGGETMTEKINCLDVPLNLAYKFALNAKSDFFIQAGPYLSYALNGKEKIGSVSTDLEFKDNVKRFDYGLGFGGGVEFGSMAASLNYQLGVADLNDVPAAELDGFKIKNKVLQLSLTYIFGK